MASVDTMSCSDGQCCSIDGKCFDCSSAECKALWKRMQELESLKGITTAEIQNTQALRDIKSLVASLAGERIDSAGHPLSPADEVSTADRLTRQLEDLDREWDMLWDRYTNAGCRIFPDKR